MIRLSTLAIASAILTGGLFSQANAWTRDSHYFGPHGHSSVHASGSCGGRSCEREVTKTGPHGRSVHREGSASCGGGNCEAERTTTGPRGNSISRSVTIGH